MKKYIVEFIGTFFLVFTVGTSVRADSPLAPLAIGSVLMVMIYAGGHISGGHFNPAVTLAAWLRGKCDTKDVGAYMGAQMLAGLAAAGLLVAIASRLQIPATRVISHSIISEFLFTFALAWVVLNSATAKANAGNSFYGLAIGFTVLSGAIAVGGVSGGAFNPAVGLGVWVMGLEKFSQFMVYLGSDLAGGAAAAFAFKFLSDGDKE